MTRARPPRRTVTVMGGAGAMGRIAVRDLVETAPADVDLVVADRDLAVARAVIKPYGRRVRAIQVDARRVRETARAIAGTTVIVNATHHTFNLDVMRTALAIRSHYCDLGGLFHVTRRQLRRHAQFKRAGLVAICGIGSAPGIVNVMARAAADGLDEVHEIHIAVGTIDRTAKTAEPALATSYSIDTVLDEASEPAALFTGGRLQFVEALSGADAVRFPEPVGEQYPARTLHSELATLPATYRSRGIREVSFRIAFPGNLMERLRFLRSLGLLSRRETRVGRTRIAPRNVLLALLERAPRPAPAGAPDEYEILRVTVRGATSGNAVEEVLDCHVTGIAAWGLGVDVDTGCPPSIVAQMILRGDIAARGVLPPERAIEPEPFFAELDKRGMRIVRSRKTRDRGPETED